VTENNEGRPGEEAAPTAKQFPDDFTSCLEAAFAYAARGWPVHPLQGKRALIQGWPRKASTDPQVIEGWWDQWPDANVGMVTGMKSGFVALDVDQPNLPEGLPATRLSRTGSGGFHMLYLHPGDSPLRNASGVWPGVDKLKADNGYIVAPPSVHPVTGRAYEWVGDDDLTELPAEIAEACRPQEYGDVSEPISSLTTSPYGRKALDAECEAVRVTEKGGRNDRLFRAAAAIGSLMAGGGDCYVHRGHHVSVASF